MNDVAAPARERRRPAWRLARAARFGALVSLLGLLAACALPAAPAADPLVLPAHWSDSGAAAADTMDQTPLARWWLRFDDPLLGDLIDQALRANPSVSGAVAALRQARALGDVPSASLWPALSGSVSAQRSHRGATGTGSLYAAGFDASWEPDLFGGMHAGVAAAEADARASAASLGDVQVSVAAEVAVDYFGLRGLQARLAMARANLASQLDTLQITQWRSDAGLASAVEVAQARASTEVLRAQIPVLQTAAGQTEHSLAVLLGQPPLVLHERLAASASLPVTPADPVLGIPADTLRQRPDVRAAEARVSAAAARVTQAQAARYPSLLLSGSLGQSALTLGALGSGASSLASVAAALTAPIFDGGARSAQVTAQTAALEQARAAYASAVLGALKDVEDALTALRHDRDRLVSLKAYAAAAQDAAQLASQRYASGLVDFQTVLETQRSLLNAQDSQASTAADLNADHVRLYKALGGGWIGSSDLPSETVRPSPPAT